MSATVFGVRLQHLGFEVGEVMEGTVRKPGENFNRPFRIDLHVVFPALWRIFLVTVGRMRGTVDIDGVARGAAAVGTLELAPFRRRMARYTFTFTADDGNEYRYDGWKSVGLNVRRAWTTCPGKIYDANGGVWADGTLYFSFRRHFPGLLASIRFLWPWRRPDPVAEPQPALHA
jgi:hypothetical protein